MQDFSNLIISVICFTQMFAIISDNYDHSLLLQLCIAAAMHLHFSRIISLLLSSSVSPSVHLHTSYLYPFLSNSRALWYLILQSFNLEVLLLYYQSMIAFDAFLSIVLNLFDLKAHHCLTQY